MACCVFNIIGSAVCWLGTRVIGRVHTTALGPERIRNATGRPCSHLFHCVQSFRNEPTTSRCDRSGTVPERVQLALGPGVNVRLDPSRNRSSWHLPVARDIRALTSDDLDTPRASVQMMLFVAVLFIQRSPGATQILFRHHNFGRATHPMIIIS